MSVLISNSVARLYANHDSGLVVLLETELRVRVSSMAGGGSAAFPLPNIP